jgi:hypothetical protein
MKRILNILTGEFILNHMPNGGTAVVLRSAFVTAYMYGLALALKSYTSECAVLSFSAEQLVLEVNETIPWAAAIFGAVYVALYTRFSSQWSYLADLYNQQLALAVTITDEQLNGDNFVRWQAAFVEDAVCMHLAKKEGFSNAVYMTLQDSGVREALEKDPGFGKDKFRKLEAELKNILSIQP